MSVYFGSTMIQGENDFYGQIYLISVEIALFCMIVVLFSNNTSINITVHCLLVQSEVTFTQEII